MSLTNSPVNDFGRGWELNYNGGTPSYTSAISASSITSNVLTLTVGVAEADKWAVGRWVTTTGLTANVATTAQIVDISDGDITIALTSADAADNGTGSLVATYQYQLLTDERLEQYRLLDWGVYPANELGRGDYLFKDPALAVLGTWVQQILYGATGVAPT